MRYVPLNVPKLVAAFEAAAGQAVVDVAESVLARAQIEAPVKTGRLRASGHVVPDPDGTKAYVAFDAESDQGFGYSVVVHAGDGSRGRPANPFLARAVLSEKTDAFARFQTAVHNVTATS